MKAYFALMTFFVSLNSFAGPCDGTGASAKEVSACQAANRFRAENGLSQLVLRRDLNAVARAHARDMVTRGYFEHDSPEGATPSDRLTRAGINYEMNAENIAQGQTTGVEVVESWKASPGHRQNLVTPDFVQHGMGEYNDTWVHVFLK